MMSELDNKDAKAMESIELTDEELDLVSGGKRTLYSVKAKSATIRSGPGANYDVVRCMSKGCDIVYLGEKKVDKKGNTWLKVSAASATGWVRADQLKM